ncbi:MAG TPA: carbohydrate ABC transporter permease [Clostridiales bacterium]|nr:carbohydrate ABC transporter permease [Clostridiales bacterium]
MKEKLNLYQILRTILLALLSAFAILPFALLFIASLTKESFIMQNGYSYFPKEWSFSAYEYLIANGAQIFRAYGISIIITVAGTCLGLALTLLFAYPLSKPDMPGRRFFNFMVFFTILFSGGLVPSYTMWTTVFHMKNSILALLIPGLLMRGFYVILAKSYFQASIPGEIYESARIDGASEVTVFSRIAIPLAKPIIATLVLFIGLDYWNDWNNGLIYLTNAKLYSIQNVLNQMIQTITFLSQNAGQVSVTGNIPSNAVRMAIAVVGTLPVLIAYPFLQKWFVKGIVMGGVKG